MAKVEYPGDDIGSGLAAKDSTKPSDYRLAQSTNSLSEPFTPHDETKNDRGNHDCDQPQDRWQEELSGGVSREDQQKESKYRHCQFREDVPNAGNKNRQRYGRGGESPRHIDCIGSANTDRAAEWHHIGNSASGEVHGEGLCVLQAGECVCEYACVGQHPEKPKCDERRDFDRRQLAHLMPNVGVVRSGEFGNHESKNDDDDAE
ncbi:unannotated protein [freshwater metagenome]|uniref:Unannotated protein n=1 Tax=freshwater metagenome TaxID=449393 RepID=A0A6J6X4G9_9ZZZZ